jgi:hypothetical protein
VKRALLLAAVVLAAGAEPVLWRDTGPVESLDLTGGPGGRDRAPRAPFTFVKEDTGGTAPKVTVRDAAGKTWSVKFGEEVKAENFASRIAWAAGYYADPTYFVREGRVEGVGSLERAARFLQGGQFRDARFELRDESLIRLLPRSSWTLDDPRLKGTRELAGLKTVLVLLSNWDPKPDNTGIMETGGRQLYAITDWGATMGRASDFTGRSKWDCTKYAADTPHLVQEIDNGFVVFKYGGEFSQEVLQGIRVEDVQWLMQRLGRLSDAQIRAALEASGADANETACFAPAVRTRLDLLARVPQGDPVVTRTRSETKVIRKRLLQ